jgi:hypothetical protein
MPHTHVHTQHLNTLQHSHEDYFHKVAVEINNTHDDIGY